MRIPVMIPLARVIYDPSADPCTLNKLTAYLSRHHCLETLQFIQDASRYRTCYAEAVGNGRIPWSSSGPGYDNLRTIWKGLLSTYIVPNGHREVNLQSKTRDWLLEFRHPDFVPHPSVLAKDDAGMAWLRDGLWLVETVHVACGHESVACVPLC